VFSLGLHQFIPVAQPSAEHDSDWMCALGHHFAHCRWDTSASWMQQLCKPDYERWECSQHLCSGRASNRSTIKMGGGYVRSTTASSFLFLNCRGFHSRVAPPVSALKLVPNGLVQGSEAIGKSSGTACVDSTGVRLAQLQQHRLCLVRAWLLCSFRRDFGQCDGVWFRHSWWFIWCLANTRATSPRLIHSLMDRALGDVGRWLSGMRLDRFNI